MANRYAVELLDEAAFLEVADGLLRDRRGIDVLRARQRAYVAEVVALPSAVDVIRGCLGD